MSELTRPPLYTSWRNLPRGHAAAKLGDFSDLHMTNLEAIDLLQQQLQASRQREKWLQESLNEAEEFRPCAELAERRLDRNQDLERQNSRLFRWSCLGYLLALGCLTYIFVTGA